MKDKKKRKNESTKLKKKFFPRAQVERSQKRRKETHQQAQELSLSVPYGAFKLNWSKGRKEKRLSPSRGTGGTSRGEKREYN